MKLQPAFHAIFLKAIKKEEKTSGGIIIKAKENLYQEYELLGVGPLAGYDKDGKLVQKLEVGQHVIVHKLHDTAEMYWEGNTFLYCLDTDVRAVVEK